ncbi:hypothetical protein V1478_017194 [Vespula squamosa]|uniref:Uncharacterized protein n=1 Tax=Vespula squamosa TaxID=30214 RepID=A0ABD1ZZ98_VESSQ
MDERINSADRYHTYTYTYSRIVVRTVYIAQFRFSEDESKRDGDGEKSVDPREASSRAFEPDRVVDSRPETILVERFAAAIGGKSRATLMEGGSGVEDGEEVCMNFNRHLIWYTSELRVPLDRDQVDLHGEDNTRCTLPARTTIRYRNRREKRVLLFCP